MKDDSVCSLQAKTIEITPTISKISLSYREGFFLLLSFVNKFIYNFLFLGMNEDFIFYDNTYYE